MPRISIQKSTKKNKKKRFKSELTYSTSNSQIIITKIYLLFENTQILELFSFPLKPNEQTLRGPLESIEYIVFASKKKK